MSEYIITGVPKEPDANWNFASKMASICRSHQLSVNRLQEDGFSLLFNVSLDTVYMLRLADFKQTIDTVLTPI